MVSGSRTWVDGGGRRRAAKVGESRNTRGGDALDRMVGMEPERLREIIASARQGDPAGFESLLAAYGPRLYGYFVRATGDHHDAEDLLGEMTFRLVRRLKYYEEKGRFEPWLFRIAANMVRDGIRRTRVRPRTLSLSIEDRSGQAMADRLRGDSEAADAGLLAAEASEQLKRAMDRLDEQTRQVILLRHFAEMSFREIAALCDCPLGTVLARVHRGMRKLRQMLGEHDGTE